MGKAGLMCLNCLVGLHNLCLRKVPTTHCSCLHFHEGEMAEAAFGLKNYYKQQEERKGEEKHQFAEASPAEVEATLAHIAFRRRNSGRFIAQKHQTIQEALRQKAPPVEAPRGFTPPKKCSFCGKEVQWGTKLRDHGVSKCVTECEECGKHPGTIKSADGFLLCARCDKEFNTQHIPAKVIPRHSPLMQRREEPDPRPPYVRPTITRLDCYSRHSVDYSQGDL